MKKYNVWTAMMMSMAIGMPTMAFAQDDGSTDGGGGGAFSSSTSTTTTTLVVLAPVMTTTTTSNAAAPRRPRRQRRRRRLRRTMVQDVQAFQQHIALGGGATVEDLATIYAVPKEQMSAFGKHVRKYRVKILDLAKGKTLSMDQVAKIDDLLLKFEFAS